MADVFETQSGMSRSFAGQTAQVPADRKNNRMRTVTFVDIDAERLRLLRLIHATQHLDWLLLTKRPENIVPALTDAVGAILFTQAVKGDESFTAWMCAWLNGNPPANFWLGTSVEDQQRADERHRHLMAAPAVVHFWSGEPLLGPIEAGPIWAQYGAPDWVIIGGESGHGARPMEADWVRSLIAQCEAAGVAPFFKQWGGVNKKATGWLLDGRTYDEFPTVQIQAV